MKDPTQDLLPEGLEDRLPQSAAAASRIENVMLRVMHGHGYDRVRPPLVEFEASMAQRMDGLSTRHTFRFIDPKSLRTLALRSDMTTQIGRIAATSLAQTQRPLRLCYAGQVARIASDMLEPRRELQQVGAELIGSDSVAAAGEIVGLAIEVLAEAGATGISVDFTLPDLVETLADGPLPLAEDRRDAVRRELDAKDAGALVEVGGEDYLPLIHAAGEFPEAADRLDAIDTAGVLDTRISALRQIAGRLCDCARLTLDPSERHGFEYQSWFGFTLYAEGVRGALGRGGTYLIGGSGEAATGFSLYPDALVESLKSAEPKDHMVFLPIGHDIGSARELRKSGWRTLDALSEDENGASLGCTHMLTGDSVQPI